MYSSDHMLLIGLVESYREGACIQCYIHLTQGVHVPFVHSNLEVDDLHHIQDSYILVMVSDHGWWKLMNGETIEVGVLPSHCLPRRWVGCLPRGGLDDFLLRRTGFHLARGLIDCEHPVRGWECGLLRKPVFHQPHVPRQSEHFDVHDHWNDVQAQ